MAANQPMGWGQVDDAESIRAIHRALDLVEENVSALEAGPLSAEQMREIEVILGRGANLHTT